MTLEGIVLSERSQGKSPYWSEDTTQLAEGFLSNTKPCLLPPALECSGTHLWSSHLGGRHKEDQKSLSSSAAKKIQGKFGLQETLPQQQQSHENQVGLRVVGTGLLLRGRRKLWGDGISLYFGCMWLNHCKCLSKRKLCFNKSKFKISNSQTFITMWLNNASTRKTVGRE